MQKPLPKQVSRYIPTPKDYSNSSIPRLFELMEERHLKAKEVSQATGISASSFTDYRKGIMPAPQKIRVLAEYFGVTVEYLMGTDADENAMDLKIQAEAKQLSENQKADVLKYIEFIKTKD